MAKKKNTERAKALNKLSKAGYQVRRFSQEECIPLAKIADAIINAEENIIKNTGGTPRYTGNTRKYSNGTIGYEIRCRKCKLKFWATTVHMAFCSDCAYL